MLSLIVGIAATVLVIRRKWEGRVFWICLGIHAILHFCLQWFRVVPNGDAFVVSHFQKSLLKQWCKGVG